MPKRWRKDCIIFPKSRRKYFLPIFVLIFKEGYTHETFNDGPCRAGKYDQGKPAL
jgi:hypothetical protein